MEKFRIRFERGKKTPEGDPFQSFKLSDWGFFSPQLRENLSNREQQLPISSFSSICLPLRMTDSEHVASPRSESST